MSRGFKAEKHIAALNNAKAATQVTGRPFSKEDMLRMLKGSGIPSNPHFWKAFKDSGIIQKVGTDKYMFTSKEPIYKDRLQNVYNTYKNSLAYYKKKEVVETAKVIEQPSIEDAIKLLKENGYDILAPVGVMYVKL